MRYWEDADADILRECRYIDCKIARIWITDSWNQQCVAKFTEICSRVFPHISLPRMVVNLCGMM